MKGGGFVNKVVLSGRLTAEPVLRKTGTGNSMVTFCIAVRSTAERTNFLNCVVYEKLADLLYKNVTKGDKITILGTLSQRVYEGKDGMKRDIVEILVQEAEFQLKLQDADVVEEPKSSIR